ncbi:hypothetical protein KAH55_07165 [bacterium]|nr:hypothetical protein [bacterium]
MNSRQRMQAAFDYTAPDKIPVFYHPSPAGLHVQGQPLLELFQKYAPDNPEVFDIIPHPDPKFFDETGRYHEISTDEWGITWEFLIYGVWGHPKAYPFGSWAEAADYQIPPQPPIGTANFEAKKKQVLLRKNDFLMFGGFVSIYERLYYLHPMDQLFIELALEDPDLFIFMDRLELYWQQHIDYLLALGYDIITFGDDWGTQTSQLISTDMFQRIFAPRYQRLFDRVHQAGAKVFFHSCGHIGEILDVLLEIGIDGLWPQIGCYDPDELTRKLKDHKAALFLHPERQNLIPRGTPAEIDTYIRDWACRFKEMQGGGIFYVEIENDAPMENIRALIEAVHKYR